MEFKIAVLEGDGIGPEISKVGVDVMNAVCKGFNHNVNYTYAICGADAIDKVGNPFPEETFRICSEADAVLFSAVGDPKYDNNPTAKVRPEQGLLAMRKKLGLYANIRPVEPFECLLHKSPLRADIVKDANFICIRELTGGMYFGEKYQDNDKAYDTNYYTRPEIERILKVGFEYARKRKKHLTVVDKANVLASSRLWRQIAQEMESEYPDITTDYMYVDNAAMRMIQEPTFFDVMVTENTFGDILTDEGSCISGSMGLLPSASVGTGTPVFEPIHGSWPQAKGKNIANPLAQILSVAMLFEHFGLEAESSLVREAVNASLDANIRTPDIQADGLEAYSTTQVGKWIVDYIETVISQRAQSKSTLKD
jgi:3-isopropylmalate dehydrogenase